MNAPKRASADVPHRAPPADDTDVGPTVLWLHGEHDVATKASVVVAISRAAQRNDADLLVDLSDVTFMDASTIGAVIGSRNRLRAHSRSLMLRAPSPSARRLLDVCGLADLVDLVDRDGAAAVHPAGAGAALGTWVDVPATRSVDGAADPPADPDRVEPARPMLPADARRSGTSAMIEADRGGP